ncbi:MAG: hypothetical protein HYX97_02260, partial [Chloroflexi bacterium]|nr:hypothetical protein [Chloroflexota bacterium]
AHEVYGYFLDINYLEWEQQFHQRFMRREGRMPYVINEADWARHQEYRSRLWLSKPLQEGQLDGWRFYHVPGHTPEELCIQRGPYLITGDHVLPQITPHPTMKLRYDLFKEALPASYREQNVYYGLYVFLRSMKRITQLEGDLTLLPSHRLYFKGKLNLIGKSRAEEIIDHHRRRLGRILDVLEQGPLSVTELTLKHFRGTELSGRFLYMAIDEVIAHLELLQEAGDVAYLPDDPHMVSATGTRGYEGLLARL